ncbi:MAG: FkbM family methyltransferase [Planctomycetota bacterium]
MPISSTIRALLHHPIGRRQRVRTLLRFGGWQLRWRLWHRRRPWPFRFVNDTRLYARGGEYGVTGNIYFGLHEIEHMALLAHLVREGDRVLDVGANSGTYSILAAGCGCRVTAFEPSPTAVERFCENVALNGFGGQVQLVQSAVGATTGTVRFTRGLDTTNRMASAEDLDEATISVPMTSLDVIKKELASPSLALKIDVEGHEAAVLAGSIDTLADPDLRVIILETTTGPDAPTVPTTGRSPVESLTLLGFVLCRYDPFSRQLEPVAEAEARNSLHNVAAVRDLEWARERVRAAPALRLPRLGISL